MTLNVLIECSVLWVLVGCVVAQTDVNDVSSLQHVVSEILRRLDEKDAQIEKLQQRLVEQETLNAEQNNRLADQDAIIDKLQLWLRELEPECAPSGETIKTAIKSTSSKSSNDIGAKSIREEKRTARRSKYTHGVI